MTVILNENINGSTLTFRGNRTIDVHPDDIINKPLEQVHSKENGRNLNIDDNIKSNATSEKIDNKQTVVNPENAEKREILIEGIVYDVTSYMRKHPGGSIIRFGLNTDASDAFRSFHFRSGRPNKILKLLPSRPYDPETDKEKFFQAAETGKADFVQDFRKLEQDLKDEGVFDPSSLHVAYRMIELVLMLAAGLYMVYLAGPNAHSIPTSVNPLEWLSNLQENFFNGKFFLFWGGILLYGLFQGRCGWLMHEGGHGSLTGHMPTDRRIQEIFYGIGWGKSAGWWRSQHNKHHAAPQKMKHDVDLDTLPLVAFNAKVVTDTKIGRIMMKSAFYRDYWLKYQHLLFGPIICLLVSTFWQFFLHLRHSYRKRLFLEGACYLIRWVGWFSIFSSYIMGWSFGFSWLMYLAAGQVAAASMFINFAVSHSHLDVTDENSNLTWPEYCSKHTMNVKSHFLTNWWMSYLNFQIEHHLFPQCPQFRFPQVYPRIKELFEKHGEKYICMGYFEAIGVTFANLKQVASQARAKHYAEWKARKQEIEKMVTETGLIGQG